MSEIAERKRDLKGRVLRPGEVQSEDGRYAYRYTDAFGKRRTIYSWRLVSTDKVPSGKRPCTALRDKEIVVRRDKEDGIRTRDARTATVDDFVFRYLDMRKDLAPTTRVNYENIYKYLGQPHLGNKTIGSVKHSEILNLYMFLLETKEYAVSTVEKLDILITPALQLAVMDNIIRANPASGAMKRVRRMGRKEKPKLRDALTVQQQTAYVDYIYKEPNYAQIRSLVTVLLGTGLRIGEALGLRWCDIDWKHKMIHIDHQMLYKDDSEGHYHYRVAPPKTATGIRSIPMLKDVEETLLREKKRWRDPNNPAFIVYDDDGKAYTDFIFVNSNGRVYVPSYIYNRIRCSIDTYNKKELHLAEYENRDPVLLPPISAHIFRHTFCTRLREQGQRMEVIQYLMGHLKPATTFVYSSVSDESKFACVGCLEGNMTLIGGNPK